MLAIRNRLDSYVTQSELATKRKQILIGTLVANVHSVCNGFVFCMVLVRTLCAVAAYVWAKTYEYLKLLNAFGNVLDVCEGKFLLLLFAIFGVCCNRQICLKFIEFHRRIVRCGWGLVCGLWLWPFRNILKYRSVCIIGRTRRMQKQISNILNYYIILATFIVINGVLTSAADKASDLFRIILKMKCISHEVNSILDQLLHNYFDF